MSKWMVECVKESPDACAKLLKNKDKIISKAVELYTAKPRSKVVLVGSGSSSNIAMCAKNAIEKFMNVKCEVVNPATFVNYDHKFNEDAFIFCMSQSGKSTNTIDALNKCKELGYDHAGIALTTDSPIRNHCENVLEFGFYTGEKDSFVCRYFSPSVIYFALFALEAGVKLGTYSTEECGQRIAELEKIVDYMPQVIKATEAFYNDNMQDLHAMKRVMVMGIGYLFGLTNEGCLKISETTGIPTNGYEVEEFLHGPAFEVKKDHALFFLDGDNIAHDRIVSIFEASQDLTDRAYLITSSDIKGKSVINIPIECDPALRPIMFVIPLQLIPGKICEDLNIRALTIYNHWFSKKVVTKASH